VNKTQHNLLGAILFFLLVNTALCVVHSNDLEVIKADMKTPKRVEITSVGVVHSFPIDNVNTKIVSAK
jgi:hypothetical protein